MVLFFSGLSSEFELTQGRLHFNFTGERCKNNLNYSLQIVLICEYANVKDPLSIIYVCFSIFVLLFTTNLEF